MKSKLWKINLSINYTSHSFVKKKIPWLFLIHNYGKKPIAYRKPFKAFQNVFMPFLLHFPLDGNSVVLFISFYRKEENWDSVASIMAQK